NRVLPSKMCDMSKAYFMRERGHLDGALALSLVIFEKTCDMLSLLLWCVFGLAWIKMSGSMPLAAFDQFARWTGIADGGFFFWFSAVVVGGVFLLGVLLIGSKKFADLFFAGAIRYAPGKIRPKFDSLAISWRAMHAYFWASKKHLIQVAAMSVFIWFLHLLQIWMFILALKSWAPFLASLALSPLALLAGL